MKQKRLVRLATDGIMHEAQQVARALGVRTDAVVAAWLTHEVRPAILRAATRVASEQATEIAGET